MKLGYLLPTREAIMRGEANTGALITAAQRAAQIGFDSLWVGDSVIARPRHDALTLLAAVSAVVPDVEVGTAVLLPALRNPVLLAQQLATVDQISQGRLIVGVGIAADTPGVRSEFEACGVPFEGRVGRMLESLRLCRQLWSGEPVTWNGRWHVQDAILAPRTARHDGPPIWLAAGVPAGIKRAADHFDGWFPIGPNADAFAAGHRHFLDFSHHAGRDIQSMTSAIYLTICVDDDPKVANAQLNHYLEQYYGVPGHLMQRVQACCGGTLDTVLEFLNRFHRNGASHLVIRVVGDDHLRVLEQLQINRKQIADGGAAPTSKPDARPL